MTQIVDPAYFTLFETTVKHKYQQMGSVFDGRVKSQSIVGNATARFPLVAAAGAPQPKAPGGQIPTTVATQSYVEITPVDHSIGIIVDRFDIDKTKINLIPTFAEALVNSMARKMDDLAIAALAETTTSNVGVNTDGLTFAKILKMTESMNAANIPRQGRKWAIAPQQESNLLSLVSSAGNYQVATSKDFVNGAPLMTGEPLMTWMGFEWVFSNRLVSTDGVRRTYAWHYDAVAQAWNRNLTPEIEWLPREKSWQISNQMQTQFKIIEAAGVFPCDCTES